MKEKKGFLVFVIEFREFAALLLFKLGLCVTIFNWRKKATSFNPC